MSALTQLSLAVRPEPGTYYEYPRSATGSLTTVEGNQLPYGHYWLAAIERSSTAAMRDPRAHAIFTLYPATLDHTATWHRSNHAYKVQLNPAALQATLGLTWPRTALMRPHLISGFFSETFKKARRPELFDPHKDYDALYKGLARGAVSKATRSGVHIDPDDVDDLIIKALMGVVNSKTIAEFKDGGDATGYFARMFQNRMISAVRDELNHHIREKTLTHSPSDDRTHDEHLDAVDTREPHPAAHDELEYHDLVTGLARYLDTKPDAKYFRIMLPALLAGKSNMEIAREMPHPQAKPGQPSALGVSPAIITRKLNELKAAILEYARHTGNTNLFKLMEAGLHQRKHSRAGEHDWLVDLFHQYRRHASIHTPAGKITTIARTNVNDEFNPDYIGSLVLSSEVTEDQIDARLKDHIAYLAAQDEIIEAGNGRIIGLRIKDTPIS